MIIGAFNHIRDAQRAVNNLYEADFPAKNIRIVANDLDENLDNNRTDSTWSEVHAHQSRGLGGFFARLFGVDEHPRDVASYGDETSKYFSQHYHRRQHLILIHEPYDRQKAIEILEACGGVIEDEAAIHYEQQLSRGAPLELSEQQAKALEHEGLHVNPGISFDQPMAERGPDRDPLSRDRPAGSKQYL